MYFYESVRKGGYLSRTRGNCIKDSISMSIQNIYFFVKIILSVTGIQPCEMHELWNLFILHMCHILYISYECNITIESAMH